MQKMHYLNESENRGVNGKGTAQKRRAVSVQRWDAFNWVPGTYIIGYGDLAKIGWSRNLGARFRQFTDVFPAMRLYTWIETEYGREIEKGLHRRFRDLKVRGEWFRFEGPLKEYVSRNIDLHIDGTTPRFCLAQLLTLNQRVWVWAALKIALTIHHPVPLGPSAAARRVAGRVCHRPSQATLRRPSARQPLSALPQLPAYEPKTREQFYGYLIEECGEVLAAAGKTLRWGELSYNPEIPPEQRVSNIDWLRNEMADLEGAIRRMRHFLDKCEQADELDNAYNFELPADTSPVTSSHVAQDERDRAT